MIFIGVWTDVDGKKITYNSWYSSQPDGGKINNYAYMNQQQGWTAKPDIASLRAMCFQKLNTYKEFVILNGYDCMGSDFSSQVNVLSIQSCITTCYVFLNSKSY